MSAPARFGAQLEIKAVESTERLIAGWAAHHKNTDRVADIIDPVASRKAVARLTSPSQVGVFIGHDLGSLPVGIPIKIEATDKGLYTETRVFEGPVGDNLLAVARGLRAHGQTLGMSIGYRPVDYRHEMRDGKAIRRLLDYELAEYSFAARQAIANPEALVVGVKTLGGAMYRIEQRGDLHLILDGQDRTISEHKTAGEAFAALGALYGTEPKAADQPWSAAYVHALPDSAFLAVKPGGELDEESKTVPRSYRTLPIRDADGALDQGRLRQAIDAVAGLAWLDGQQKARLRGYGRDLLDSLLAGKTAEYAPEAQGVAPLDLRAIGYALLDLADELVAEHKAQRLLGEETYGGARIRSEMRGRLRGLVDEAVKVATRAEQAESGDLLKAQAGWYRRQLELLEVG